jgi:hypothetical protein
LSYSVTAKAEQQTIATKFLSFHFWRIAVCHVVISAAEKREFNVV